MVGDSRITKSVPEVNKKSEWVPGPPIQFRCLTSNHTPMPVGTAHPKTMNHTVKISIPHCDETRTPIPYPMAINNVVAMSQNSPKAMRTKAHFRHMAMVIAPDYTPHPLPTAATL